MSRKAELINETNPPGSPRRSSRIAQVLTTVKTDPRPATPRTRRASVGSDAEDSTTPIRRRRSSVDKELPRREKKSSISEQPTLESITETSFSKGQGEVEPVKEKEVTPKTPKREKKLIPIAKSNLETISEANVSESPEKVVVEASKEEGNRQGSSGSSRMEKVSVPAIVVIEATPAKDVAKVLKESVPVDVSVTEKKDLRFSKNSKDLMESVTVEASDPVNEKEDLNSSKNSSGSDKENINFSTEAVQAKRISDVFRPKNIEYSFEEPMEVDVTIAETEVDSEVLADETKTFSVINENNVSDLKSPLFQAAKTNSLNEIVLEAKQNPLQDTQDKEISINNMESKKVGNPEKIVKIQNQSSAPEDMNPKRLCIDLERNKRIENVLEEGKKVTKENLKTEQIVEGIESVKQLEKVETSVEAPTQPSNVDHANAKKQNSLHLQQKDEEINTSKQTAEVVKEIPEQLPQNESSTDSKLENMNESESEIKENQQKESVEELQKTLQPEKIAEPIDKIDLTNEIISETESPTETQPIEKLGQDENGKCGEEQLQEIDGTVEQEIPTLVASSNKMSSINKNSEKLHKAVEELEEEEKRKVEQSQQTSSKVEQEILEPPPSNAKVSPMKRRSSDNSEKPNEIEKEEKCEEKQSLQIEDKVEQETPELPPSDSKLSSVKRISSDNSEKLDEREERDGEQSLQSDGKVEQEISELSPSTAETYSVKRKSTGNSVKVLPEKEEQSQQVDGNVEQELPELPPSNVEVCSIKRRRSNSTEKILQEKEQSQQVDGKVEQEILPPSNELSPSSDQEDQEVTFELKISADDHSVVDEEIYDVDEMASIQIKKPKIEQKLHSLESETLEKEVGGAPEVESEERVEIIVNENVSMKPTENVETNRVEMLMVKSSRKTKSLGHINFKSTTEILRDEKGDTKIEREVGSGITSASTSTVESKKKNKKRLLPQSSGEVPKKKKKETTSPVVVKDEMKIAKELASNKLETQVVRRIRPTTIIRDNLSFAWFVEFDELGLKPSTTNI